MRTIDADALKELFSEVIGHIAQKPEMNGNLEHMIRASAMVIQMIDDAPSVQPDASKYEYHYDHTDCIWYGGGSNKCPSTCSQYRDGWNDAMNYIFRDGKGYRPYRRGEQYEE